MILYKENLGEVEVRVCKFWVPNLDKHPTVLVGYFELQNLIYYATSTWDGSHRFSRRFAHDKVNGQLCSKSCRKIDKELASGFFEIAGLSKDVRIIILKDIIDKDNMKYSWMGDDFERVRTRLCRYYYTHLLWLANSENWAKKDEMSINAYTRWGHLEAFPLGPTKIE